MRGSDRNYACFQFKKPNPSRAFGDSGSGGLAGYLHWLVYTLQV